MAQAYQRQRCHSNQIQENAANSEIPSTVGKFIEIEDPSSVADVLDYYLSDCDIRKAHGLNARRFITKEYTWDNVINKMKAAVEKAENV